MAQTNSKSALQQRIDKHLAACAAVAAAAVAAGADEASAAINYSGPQNIPVSFTDDGFFLNFETGDIQNGVPGAPGYDVNIFSYSAYYDPNPIDILPGMFYAYVGTFTLPGLNNVVGSGNYPSRLADGVEIGPTSSFVPNNPGNLGLLAYGTPPFEPFPGVQWSPSAEGFLGERFQISTDGVNDVHYGWIRLSIGELIGSDEDSEFPTTIIDWAWETQPNTPILAGQVPEPGAAALALLALGSLGSRCWRKRHA